MTFNDLLAEEGLNPKQSRQVMVMRHRPGERDLRKALPWLAAEHPEVFNAYQQSQGEKVEKALAKTKYLASFISYGPGRALFVGVYKVQGSRPVSYKQFWRKQANIELRKLGMRGERRKSWLWFDLVLTPICERWKGKLIVSWPGLARSWWRRAERNEFPVEAIAEESLLVAKMPRWNELRLSWEQLKVLPDSWKLLLSQWRGVYFIFDASDAKGYVGSAYGDKNLYGRWRNYKESGDGGNKLLRKREPRSFTFSILELVAPNAPQDDVIHLESTWKERLHTREFGLNDN